MHPDRELLFGQILDAVDDAILVVDRKGEVRYASAGARRLFGKGGGDLLDLVGRDAGQLLDGELDARSGRHDDVPRMLNAIGDDGTRFAVDLLKNAYVSGGDEPLRLIAIRDARKLTPLDPATTDVVATLTHELRTPLSAIIGSLKLIDGGAVGEFPTRMAPMIEMAHRNAERMLVMINDVLEAETIRAGRVEMAMRPVDLATLVRDSVEAYRSIAVVKEIDLNLCTDENPAEVMGNSGRLDQVLANLISNAVKFSDPGGKIEVRLECAGSTARIIVADGGPGIPVKFQPLIFEKFAKLDLEDGRNRSGIGLGLGISKAIVEAHAGQIGFASQPGDTRFWVDLPLRRVHGKS